MKKISILIIFMLCIVFPGVIYAEGELVFSITADSTQIDLGDSESKDVSLSIGISEFTKSDTIGSISNCTFKMNIEGFNSSNGEGWTVYPTSDGFSLVSSTPIEEVSSTTGIIELLKGTYAVSEDTTITLSNISCYDSDPTNSYTASDVSVSIDVLENSTGDDGKEDDSGSEVVYDASLKSLTITPSDSIEYFKPTFDSQTTGYVAMLLNDKNSITITAVPNDSNATVSIMVNNQSVGSFVDNTATALVNITDEETIVEVVVVNNTAEMRYKINVIKPSNSEVDVSLDLAELKVNDKRITLMTSANMYTAYVDNDVSSAKIEATLEDSNAKFVENYGSREVSLNVGNNLYDLVVVGSNGETITYQVNIIRANSSSSSSSVSLPSSKSSSNPNTAGPLSITFIILFMVISLFSSLYIYKKHYSNI